MNQFERISDPEEAEQKKLDSLSAQIRVAMPGIVKGVNLAAQTVTVQIALQGKISDDNGEAWTNMPLLQDVPIVWPRAGGFALTLPVKTGDECLVVFGDRCIDSWWQSGGVQKPMDERTHDLSDAFAVFGITSQPRKLANVQSDAIEIRTDSRSDYISLKNGALNINIAGAITVNCNSATITSPSNTINGPLTVTGLISGQGGMTISGGSGANVTGNLTTTGDVKANGISLQTHTHNCPQGGNTGPAK